MKVILKVFLYFIVFLTTTVALVKHETWKINQFERHEIKMAKGTYELKVPCNRFHNLMLAFHITPPLPFEPLSRPYTHGKINIKYSNLRPDINIDLKDRGGFFSGGLWKQSIMFLPAQFFRLCSKTTMTVTIEGLDIDLEKHEVQLYFMKDGRP